MKRLVKGYLERPEIVALAVLIAGVAGGLVYLGPRWGREIVIPGIALGGLSILAAGYIRTTLMVTYDHPDVPVEPLIYVQSTPDVPFIANEIARIAAQTGQGKDMKILLDNGWGDGDHEAVSWPFEWYLRDYKNRRYYTKTIDSTINLADYPVLLARSTNLDPIQAELAQLDIPRGRRRSRRISRRRPITQKEPLPKSLHSSPDPAGEPPQQHGPHPDQQTADTGDRPDVHRHQGSRPDDGAERRVHSPHRDRREPDQPLHRVVVVRVESLRRQRGQRSAEPGQTGAHREHEHLQPSHIDPRRQRSRRGGGTGNRDARFGRGSRGGAECGSVAGQRMAEEGGAAVFSPARQCTDRTRCPQRL